MTSNIILTCVAFFWLFDITGYKKARDKGMPRTPKTFIIPFYWLYWGVKNKRK